MKILTYIILLSDDYAQQWAVRVHKKYEVAAKWVRAIHPKKKPPHAVLSVEDYLFDMSSERIIVENYLGRMCILWTVFFRKYR